jgi:2-polyprenyl-3-methyl-5-hydroxy-6-metoxy-1,4-benzoquinol methylase
MTNPLYQSKLSDVKLKYIAEYLSGKAVLDVGAGHCYYGQWLLDHDENLNITAIDWLEQEPIPGIKVLQMDLEEPIGLPSEKFNTIFAFDIIEHITHEAQFVQELFRLCTPGGYLLGSVPHDNDGFLPAYNLTFNHRSDLTHKRYYIPQTLEKVLKDSGFEVICIDQQGGVSPQVIAEFFPSMVQFGVKKMVGLLRRIGLINTKRLSSDLLFVARKKI